MTQIITAGLSDVDGSAGFSGILVRDHEALGDDRPVFVIDGVSHRADDVVYGGDGSWAKAGQIVLASYLADGTHDIGSLADEFVSMMTDRLPVVDHSRLDTIRRERCWQALENRDDEIGMS
ncbi:hypothetical protein [Paludisphaera sp.]|uniref:hypothetical protein n=1 Tax=Paludisphaera sp. TaxID=2017432 RepID=UPI00301B6C7B